MSHYREPVKHTCPDIDKLIKSVEFIYRSIKGYERLEEIDDFKDILGTIDCEISDFVDILERLRSSNDALRQWGVDEANQVDDLNYQLSNLERDLERAENMNKSIN